MSEEIAWAAGLFEGEGCIATAGSNDHSAYTRLVLQMTDKDIVRRFAEIVDCGNVAHSDPPGRQSHHKTSWRWSTAQHAHVEAILLAFMPFFGHRRLARAQEALRAWDERVLKVRRIPQPGPVEWAGYHFSGKT